MNTNVVRDILKTKKITQRQLAKQIGVTTTGLNQILLGNVNPKNETVEKIAAALGVQVALLMTPSSIHIQNGGINVGGNLSGKMKAQNEKELIYTTTGEIELMRQEILSLKEIIKSKNETIESLKQTIEALRR